MLNFNSNLLYVGSSTSPGEFQKVLLAGSVSTVKKKLQCIERVVLDFFLLMSKQYNHN